jgi:DNA-binding CsgD family transcriptional regulator/tetratricopeptide (TPR) repeat protein
MGGELIGREAELRALVDAIHADRSTVVAGEAGIGKTTLVRAAIAATGRRSFEGGGFATLDWLPYLALRRALGVPLQGDAASVAAQLEHVVGPDILFVDDLQWVDHDSREAIELAAGRILVISAIRTGDPGADGADETARRAAMERLEIGPLDDAAASRIVGVVRPGLHREAAARIVRDAGGNPLLLEELAVAGQASTVLGRALSRRIELLSPDARTTVELLAVAGEPLARAAAGPGVDEVLRDGIARATRDGLEIRHELVADAVRLSLSEEHRAAINLQLAAGDQQPLSRARHLAAAGQAGPAGAAAQAGLEAATDPRDRAALLVIAAAAAEPALGMEMRLRAARDLDEALDWAGVQRALEPSGEVGTEEQLAEREALLAHAAYALGDLATCRVLLEAAAARVIDLRSGAAVRRGIERATYLVNGEGDVEGALAALDLPAETDESRVLRASIVLLATGTGDPEVVSSGLERAFAAGHYRTATDDARVLQFMLLFGSSVDRALEFLLAQRERFAAAAGLAGPALSFLADAVVAAVLAGRLEFAATLADELLEQPAPLRPRQTATIYGARARFLLGRYDQAAEALASIAPTISADFFGRGELLAAQAELALWSGRAGAAAGLAEAALDVPGPIPIAHVPTMLTQAWARLELGQDPPPPMSIQLTPSLRGAAPEVEGIAAWQGGDWASASAAFDRAATAWGAFNVTARLRCAWAAAESLRRCGDDDGAVERLRVVLSDALGIGFEPLVARIRRSLRLAGVRTTGTARSPASAPGHLTARETELVGLVGQGFTNMEIARRLGLGRPTVTRILASAMTKLDVASRAQLAASWALSGVGVPSEP